MSIEKQHAIICFLCNRPWSKALVALAFCAGYKCGEANTAPNETNV